MAHNLSLYWRCEAASLDPTDDFTLGDNLAQANGGVSFSATAMRIGTNGILTVNASDWYEFAPASIFTTAGGSFGAWMQYKTAVFDGNQAGPVAFRNTALSADVIAFAANATGDPGLFLQRNGGSSLTLTAAAGNMVVDTWYFLVGRVDFANNKRKIEIYNTAGTLIDSNEDLVTSLAGVQLTAMDEIRIGTPSTNANPIWVDNVFISQNYDEPIQDYMFITSITELVEVEATPLMGQIMM